MGRVLQRTQRLVRLLPSLHLAAAPTLRRLVQAMSTGFRFPKRTAAGALRLPPLRTPRPPDPAVPLRRLQVPAAARLGLAVRERRFRFPASLPRLPRAEAPVRAAARVRATMPIRMRRPAPAVSKTGAARAAVRRRDAICCTASTLSGPSYRAPTSARRRTWTLPTTISRAAI
jgi:hypothetical protein